MPITVKLSERFYHKFGHDLVDEMVNWFNDRRESFRARWTRRIARNFAS
jgi:hypothetical protein